MHRIDSVQPQNRQYLLMTSFSKHSTPASLGRAQPSSGSHLSLTSDPPHLRSYFPSLTGPAGHIS